MSTSWLLLFICHITCHISCANLTWEEIPYIINKSSNLGISDHEWKVLSYQEQCNLINNLINLVLVANYFQYKVDVFFKGNMLDGLLVKTKRYGIHIELQGAILKHMQLYGFLMSQTFKMELPTLSLLRKKLVCQIFTKFMLTL